MPEVVEHWVMLTVTNYHHSDEMISNVVDILGVLDGIQICQDVMIRGRNSGRTYIKNSIFVFYADVETCN